MIPYTNKIIIYGGTIPGLCIVIGKEADFQAPSSCPGHSGFCHTIYTGRACGGVVTDLSSTAIQFMGLPARLCPALSHFRLELNAANSLKKII